MRRIKRLLKLGMLLGLASTFQPAQGAMPQPGRYPDKPVRMIIPFPPGGGVDAVARIVSQALSEVIGQSIINDNRGGAGTVIGTELAARSTPDGYTLFLGGTASHAISPSLHRKLSYDPVRDFAPIATLASTPYVLVKGPALPARDIKELIALSKAKPGGVSFASSGTGSTMHLTGELFKMMAGIDLLHVPYKGAAQGVIDLIGGRVHLTFIPPSLALPHLETGRLVALGVTSTKRTASLPDVAPIAELGVKGFEVTAWYGILAPAKTPRPIVVWLNGKIGDILKSPALQRQFSALGLEPWISSPEQFAAYIRTELDTWGKVVKVSGAASD